MEPKATTGKKPEPAAAAVSAGKKTTPAAASAAKKVEPPMNNPQEATKSVPRCCYVCSLYICIYCQRQRRIRLRSCTIQPSIHRSCMARTAAVLVSRVSRQNQQMTALLCDMTFSAIGVKTKCAISSGRFSKSLCVSVAKTFMIYYGCDHGQEDRDI